MNNTKKIIIICSVILIFAAIVFALKYNDMVSFNNAKYYKQGVEFYKDSDYQNAYYNFGQVKPVSPLYSAAILKQAICAEKIQDYHTAIKKYRLITDKHSKSLFIHKARYNLAKCYFMTNQFKEAKKQFTHIQKHGVIEDYIIASNYFLGMLNKQEAPEEAKNYFINYISLSPTGTFALSSAEELTKLGIILTSQEKMLAAKIYFINKDYRNAMHLSKYSDFNDAWPYISIIHKNNKNNKLARAAFIEGFQKHSGNIAPEILNAAIDSYIQIYPQGVKQGLFYLSKFSQENKTAGEDYILYRLSKYLNTKEALKLHSSIYYKYPKSEYAPESLWYLFWDDYKIKDYQSAKKKGMEHLKMYPTSVSNPKMLFWMAKLSFKQNKISEGNSYLNKILSKYKDDYYAYRADSILKNNKSPWETKPSNKIDPRKAMMEFPISHSIINIKDLKLIHTLLLLEDYEIWSELNYNNKIVESWFLQKSGSKTRSIILARDWLNNEEMKPSFSDDVYKLVYPLYWAQSINENAAKLNLDPYLIISIMREESYFNPEITSSANAIGLMQLLPTTAKYIALQEKLPVPTVSILKQPEQNILYGSNYVRYVKNSLQYKDLFAIAAYNGGPNAVKNWQERLSYEDYDEFVENIPYPETRNYVKKVFKSYWNYLNIYNN